MSVDSRRLREVMRPAVSIQPDESIRLAAERMAAGHHPALIVIEEGRVIGVLSNRDLVAKVVALSLSADETKVSDVMNSEPVRMSDDRDMDNVHVVLQARDAHEIVVQDFTGTVVGIYCDCGCHDREAK